MPDLSTEQIYGLVNSLSEEALGQAATIKVEDVQSLVALGDTVMGPNLTEAWLNTLATRIHDTIFAGREYRNKLDDMVVSQTVWEGIVQKISMNMPEAEADQSYGLVDGSSVDQYKVRAPKAVQKLFYKRTPYQIVNTVQRKHLREAFLSNAAIDRFISLQFLTVRNKLELTLETLARACLSNFIAEAAGTAREIKLVTMYNNETTSTLTPAQALNNKEFLRYAVAQIKRYMSKITDMSTLYNDGSITRFTPYDRQRVYMHADFISKSETISQVEAFNENFVRLVGYKELNFWQNQVEGNTFSVSVERASDGKETSVNNIIGVVTDMDAIGVYQYSEEVLTTPVNAAMATYNTFWHERQMWFNDLSENGCIFTLN